MPETSVFAKSWGELTTGELYSFLKLRTDVFFVEQKVDEEELDNRDDEPTTIHYWVQDASGTAAYLRVLVDEHPQYLDAANVIGRVVVRADRRGTGLAKVLMARALEDLSGQAVMLHAQFYVASLYAKFGFEAFGDVYLEAGLEHLSMYRPASA